MFSSPCRIRLAVGSADLFEIGFCCLIVCSADSGDDFERFDRDLLHFFELSPVCRPSLEHTAARLAGSVSAPVND